MKKFNQSIQIEVEVDTIANQLRSMFRNDAANADVVVEQIIGRSLTNDTQMLSKIMNAMNGFQKEMTVIVGKTYQIKPMKIWGFWTQESIDNNSAVYGEVSEAVVLEINQYRDEEILIEYMVPNKTGELSAHKQWCSAATFS
jgi:hypothetical protein